LLKHHRKPKLDVTPGEYLLVSGRIDQAHHRVRELLGTTKGLVRIPAIPVHSLQVQGLQIREARTRGVAKEVDRIRTVETTARKIRPTEIPIPPT